MAYVFTKTMTLAQKFEPRRAAEQAEMLEVWSRFAMFTLLRQIAAVETSEARFTKDDEKSLARCRAIVGALAILCALAAKVKRGCLRRVRVFGQSITGQDALIMAIYTQRSGGVQTPYFDSG